MHFRRSYDRYRPQFAVLIAPVGVKVSDGQCDCLEVVGSTSIGDILGSVWQVCVWGWTMLKMFDGPQSVQYTKTLGERYSECGLLIAGDGRGMIHRQAMQFSR